LRVASSSNNKPFSLSACRINQYHTNPFLSQHDVASSSIIQTLFLSRHILTTKPSFALLSGSPSEEVVFPSTTSELGKSRKHTERADKTYIYLQAFVEESTGKIGCRKKRHVIV